MTGSILELHTPKTFSGLVSATWLPDGRRMQLNEPFGYIDANGKIWYAERASIVDGASIPKLAWSIVGGPFSDFYRDASVIHDVYCDSHLRPAQEVHDVFLEMMLVLAKDKEEKERAETMYWFVDKFGPRW